MNENLKIVIAGCGWLGQQIGSDWLKSGALVFGTYRSESTKYDLLSLGIDPIYYDFSTLNSQISTEKIGDIDLLIVALPPLKRDEPAFFGQTVLTFLDQLNSSCKVIFSSSTGVYPQVSGTYSESFLFNDSDQLNSIALAEKLLQEELGERLCVLRFGGLIGKDRHQIRHLSGRSLSGDGDVTVNLIHAEDILRLIHVIARSNLNGIYNVVHPIHSNKRTYYTNAAIKLGFTVPHFGSEKEPDRKIEVERLTSIVGFRLLYSPEDWTQFTEVQ